MLAPLRLPLSALARFDLADDLLPLGAQTRQRFSLN